MRSRRRLTLALLLIVLCARPAPAQPLDLNQLVKGQYLVFLNLIDGYRVHDEARMRSLRAFWLALEDTRGVTPLVLDQFLRQMPMSLAPLAEMSLMDLALDAFEVEDKAVAAQQLHVIERLIEVKLSPALMPDGDAIKRQRRFARDWYLVMIWLQQARGQYADTERRLEKARERFPDDADVFLSSGTYEDIQLRHTPRERLNSARMVMPSNDKAHDISFDNAMGLSRKRQQEERAIGYFRTAIRLDPHNAEARIRLAHLLAWTQSPRLDEELTLLKEAHTLAPKPPLSYLSALFAGDVEERLAHLDEAATWYRNAVAACPRAQTARLALSHVQLDQDIAGIVRAQNALRPLLGGPPAVDHVCEPDPWRMYDLGQAWRLDDLLIAMRAYVREPVEGSQP